MKPYSSSTLKLFSHHCPAALGFHEGGAIRLSAWNTAPGVAAHAIAQRVGDFANANERPATASEIDHVARLTCDALMAKGREFRGTHEPPMSPEDAFAGRDIIVPWLKDNPLSPRAMYEHELWLVGRNYSALFDVHEVREEGDEEAGWTVAESWDYKSAWPTGEGELDTLQLRGHAVLLWENYPTADVISYGVINLRTRQRYSRELYRGDDEHQALVKLWRCDIIDACRAAQTVREARPGVNCMGCPFGWKCDAAWDFVGTDNTVVEAYAGAAAERDHFAPLARAACKDEPVEIPGGTVGYVSKDARKPAADASKTIAHQAFDVAPSDAAEWDADNAKLLGLLAALNLGLTQIDKFSKWLYPGKDDKDARADLLDTLTESTIKTEFKVVRGVEFLLEGEE